MLCGWGAGQAGARPAAAPARGGVALPQGVRRTPRQWPWQYCLVLEVGCGDPAQEAGSAAPFQQADVEVQVLMSCDAGLVRSKRTRLCEQWKGNGGVLGGMGGVTLVLRMVGDAQIGRAHV